jgi:hypothetical protein
MLTRLDGVDIETTTGEDELDARYKAFHIRTATKAVDIILSLGGIYVKLGQVMIKSHFQSQSALIE